MNLLNYLCKKAQPPPRDIDDTLTMASIVKESQVVVTPIKDKHDGNTVYALKGKQDQEQDSDWVIVIRDAASALQCLRSSPGPHKSDIVSFLLRLGIAFNTFTSTPRSGAPEKPRFVSLGFRGKGYKPDKYDYAAYEVKRDEFLMTSRGRCALQAGGIVWRLAIDTSDTRSVLDGPSPTAPTFGVCHRSAELGDAYDDKLTVDELDLICGVYKVRTQSTGNQFSHLSWWPRQSPWLKSGLNWGFWTANDETWFQKRLQDIRAGKASALSSTEWNSGTIKMSKETAKAVRSNQVDAANFFDQETNVIGSA